MPQFVIEREMPGAGSLGAEDLKLASQTSCSVLQRPRAANPVGPQLRHRQQDLLHLSRAERGHHPRACAARRLSGQQDLAGPNHDRPDDGRVARRRARACRTSSSPTRGPTSRSRALIADALREDGFEVWRDDELPAHRAYAEVIEERIKGASAVVVLWSAEAAKSQWVRAEADTARAALTLVQATLDGTMPPMPFNQIQCADLKAWDGQRVDAPAGASWSPASPSSPDRRPRRAASARTAIARRLGLRAAVPEHERRCRAGIFQRRHQRGHHHRSVEGLGARGDRAQHRLHLQGPVGERLRGRARSSASPTCSKAACARPATRSGSPRS